MNNPKRVERFKLLISNRINTIKSRPSIAIWSAYLVIAFLFIAITWRGTSLKSPTQVDLNKNLTAADYSNDIFWDIRIDPPDLHDDGKTVFSLRAITLYVPKDEAALPEQFCMDEIYAYENAFLNKEYGFTFSVQKLLGPEAPPICVSLTKTNTYIMPENQQHRIFEHSFQGDYEIEYQSASEPVNFYYPYDGFNADIAFQVKFRIISQGKEVRSGLMSPRLNVYPYPFSEDWNVDIKEAKKKNSDIPFKNFTLENLNRITQYNVLVLRYDRSVVVRFSYPIILASILIFVIMLSYLEDIGTFIEGSAGVLFGIFGARAVLVGIPIAQGRTITDILFMLLYLAFALSVAVFLFRQWNKNNKKLNST